MSQINLEDLVAYLEESKVPSHVIDSVVSMAKKEPSYPQDDKTKEAEDAIIRLQIANESDWRKRAALSALLISRSL